VRSINRKAALAAGLAWSCVGVATSAAAQDKPQPDAATPKAQSPDAIGDIIITARKRAEPAQSVPIAVTVLGDEALRTRNVQSLADVSRFVPNLTLDMGQGISGGSSSASIYIRGIGQNDPSPTADPGVGLYVDGVYIGRSVGSLLDVVDLDRIEVLRGPQGTLFGKNTIGGAISLTSRRPGDTFGGRIEGELGGYDLRGVRATVDLPFSSTFAATASFAYRHREGFARSLVTGEKYGGIDHLSGRGLIRWKPDPAFTVTLIIDGSQQRDDGQFVRPVAPFNPTIPSTITLLNNLVYSKPPYNSAYDSRWLPTSTYTNFATSPAASDADIFGISGTLEWQLGPGVTLTSISAYRRLKTYIAVDSDASPLPVNYQKYNDIQKQFSQELRLDGTSFGDRLNWTLGGYYFHEDIRNTALLDAFHGLYPAVPNTGLDLNVLEHFNPKNRAYAVFGQATIKLSNTLSLTGGLRYNREHKYVSVEGQRLVSNTVFLPFLERSLSFQSWTPKVSLEFKPRKGMLLYASVSVGFKSGGINYQVVNPSDFVPYKSESATTYEIGSKADFFSNRLRVNIALFDTKYSDLQLRYRAGPGQFNCPTTAAFCSFVVNAAKVDVRGGELELTARPVAGLELNGSVGHVTERFTSIDPLLVAGNVVNANTQLPKTPRWTFGLGGGYSIPIKGVGSLNLRTDYSWKSSQFIEISNSPRLRQAAYGLLSGRIALMTVDKKWEFALSGENLTNEVYITSGSVTYASTGADGAGYGLPRTWRLSASYKF
jgi:iron complex outermembrane receptor protein